MVAGGGDADADGTPDLVTSARFADPSGMDSGLARVILGATPIAEPFCDSLPNSTGQMAVLAGHGTNSVSANHLTLLASSVPALQNGLFVNSPDEAAIPLGNGPLCLGNSTQGFVNRLPFEQSTVDQTMIHALDLDAPPIPGSLIVPGTTWNFQAWFRDVPAGGAGFNFSNGVAIRFSP